MAKPGKSAPAKRAVSILYDGKASIRDQLNVAELLVAGDGNELGDDAARTNPYQVLRRVHHAREVLDWLLSPRGLSRLYKNKAPDLDLFICMWRLLRGLLLGRARGDTCSGVTVAALEESMSPARTLPVVATRICDGLQVFRGNSDAVDAEFFGAYDVLSDVVEVLCLGVRRRVFAMQGDAGLNLLSHAGRILRWLHEDCPNDARGRGPALRFVACTGELFVLQMGSGRRDRGNMKDELIARISYGAFYRGDEAQEGSQVGKLREHCRMILRRALFHEDDEAVGGRGGHGGHGVHGGRGVKGNAEEKRLKNMTAWARMADVHPRLVPWMIETYPSSSSGPSVSELFFGFADVYMEGDREDVAGLSRLLGSLRVRGVDVYRSVGDEGQAMFTRVTRISDFLMESVGVAIPAAIRGIDSILAIEHRGIEAQIQKYWRLLSRLADLDMDATCRSLDVFLIEYNKLRRLDVLFRSMKFDTSIEGTDDPWNAVVRSPTAMASVRRALGRIPAGQSVRFIDLVGEWILSLNASSRIKVCGMASAILDSVPVDLNNAGNVATKVRSIIVGNGGNLASPLALDIVTRLHSMHDTCCRIDPNISPCDHGVPVALMEDLVGRLRLQTAQGIQDPSVARSLLSAIAHRLKIDCEALSRSQTRVGLGDRDEDDASAMTQPSKRLRTSSTGSNICVLMNMLSEVLEVVDAQNPGDISGLVDTDEWWFDIAMEHLGATNEQKRDTLVRQLLSAPARAGRAFCALHVKTVIDMAPAREDPEWAGPVPIFAEDVEPSAVLAHYELLVPSVGTILSDECGGEASMGAVYELCMAHCAHALMASPRDEKHVQRVIGDLVRQAKCSRGNVLCDRIRSSIALLDMAMGSSALMDIEMPETLDATTVTAAVELGRLVSDDVQEFSVGGLASIVEEDDSPIASLMAIRGLLRTSREKSGNTQRVICTTLVELAREKLDPETIGDNLLIIAGLASTYSVAIRAQVVNNDMLALAPTVFDASMRAAKLAFGPNHSHGAIIPDVTGFIETYALVSMYNKPRISGAGSAALRDAVLSLLHVAPRGVGKGHMCRPNAPKEAMAIAASSFDPKGNSRRCVLRILHEIVAGSTRDECTSLLRVALGGCSLEHAELLLTMLEESGNGVLRELLNNQVDNIVYSLVEKLPAARHAGRGVTGTSNGLEATTILRCLESIVCRPARFKKFPKRVTGTILSAVQSTVEALSLAPPGNEMLACFDGSCHLVRGMLRHQTSTIGRYLHLVAGVVSALQGSLLMMFLMHGEASDHLLEGFSRLLEEFSKIRAVQPYLKDAILTHIKLFMAPIERASLEECLGGELQRLVPGDRFANVAVSPDALRKLLPGMAAVYGACREDDIQDVYACLAAKRDAGEWRLRLEDLKSAYEGEFKYRGKV